MRVNKPQLHPYGKYRCAMIKMIVAAMILCSPVKTFASIATGSRAQISEMNVLLVAVVVMLLIVIAYRERQLRRLHSRAYSSDQRFRKLYDAGLVGLIFTNLDGKVVEANKAFLDIIGYTKEDVKKGEVNWNKLTPPEYADITKEGVRQMHEQGYCSPFEKEYIRKDGRRVSIMLGSSRLAENDFAEAVTYVIDVSYKKQAELREQELNRTIKKQREELYSILMNAPAMIAIRRGPELRLEFSNKVASDFANLGSGLGLTTKELMEKFKVMADPQLSQEVYRTGVPFSAKAFHIQMDRVGNGKPEDIWLDMVLEPVYDADGNVDGVAFFGFDVTGLIKANEEVKESENRFRFLADAIPHKMWTSGPDGHATYYNKGWYDYTGVTDFKALNKRAWEIIHPDDFEAAKEAWTRVVKNGESLESEQRFLNTDGEYLWHLTRVYPHKDENGKVIMWVGTSTNIHEQKMTQEALKVSEEHFKAIANNNSIIIWQANGQGALIYVNDTWKNYTGFGISDDLLEQTLAAVHPDDVQAVVEKLGSEFQARTPLQTKFRFRNKEGQYRWVLTYANPLFNPEFAGYIGSIIDIDDQERAQKAASKLLKQRDEFLGVASHELKTPITSLKASMQILEKLSEKDFDPAKIRPFVAMANKQVGKLTDIVDDLLDVTRIQSGKMQLNCTNYLFSESVQDCINEIAQYTSSHQIVVNKNEPLEVYADRTRIEQVMVNFLSNAIKYSPEQNKVTVNIEKAGSNLKFSVTDFGIGIPQDKQAYIFDRFFRVHESSYNFSGLGLGLYISSEIIGRHGGKVGLVSEEGKGSTFWFTLPLTNKSEQV
ncbi:PAS domain S-box protein [Mucilaginibacter ginsenosidivorans]|uniref:histidine kinase n=2 Tax=Mucilaginibacter ginsenosidivorans TaxID=398053 RepID=A0A5B8UXZ0_9SPHI|nr:PAS domain S-box protein [Mucilaginibacter ginsenosidivorans]